MTAGAKLTNEQSLHLEFINRFRCEAQHEHAQDWNITQQGRWTGAQHRLCPRKIHKEGETNSGTELQLYIRAKYKGIYY